MFITTSCRLRVLNVLLILALLGQLLSGCPSQVLELWCLKPPRPCYRTVVRRWRQPLREAPFQYKLDWLIHRLARTWPRWLLRCGLLLALLLWKRAVCPPLAWGLLAEPLVEVLCLGLGASPLMDMRVALFLAVGYFLLNIHVHILAYTERVFRISYGRMGPTEVRIFIFAINVVLIFWNPVVAHFRGLPITALDVGGMAVGTAFVIIFVVSAIGDAIKLDRQDRVKWKSK